MTELYRLNTTSLESLPESPFNSENEIRSLVESNLGKFLSLELVASEFRLKNFRLDTLAFDRAANSFVIIEYKKSDNHSLIDQGFAYLALMLRNKDSFTLKYNTALGKSLKPSAIAWRSSKVIFISQSFTPYQQNLTAFNDLPVELYTIKKFTNCIISFEKLLPAETLSLTNLPKPKPPPRNRKQKKDAPSTEHPLKTHSTLTSALSRKLEKKLFNN